MVSYLCHNPVSSGSLFILEYDVGVVVGDQSPELLVVAGDGSVWNAGGGQRSLREVWLMLLEDERQDLARATPPKRPPPGAATGNGGKAGGDGEPEQHDRAHDELGELLLFVLLFRLPSLLTGLYSWYFGYFMAKRTPKYEMRALLIDARTDRPRSYLAIKQTLPQAGNQASNLPTTSTALRSLW